MSDESVFAEPVRRFNVESLRRNIYHLLHSKRVETRAQKATRLTLATLILLSIALIVLVSIPNVDRSFGKDIDVIQSAILILFTCEYLLRAWTATLHPGYRRPFWGRLRYLVSFVAVIDLVAILPVILPEWLPFNLTFVRAGRLLILLRVISLDKYSRSMQTIADVLHRKRREIATSFFILLMLVLCSSIAIYYVEHDTQPKVFSSVPASFWWAIATITTVGGYSNAFPISDAGRLCAVFVSLLGVTTIALPSGIIAAGLMEEYHKQSIRCPHCGGKMELKEDE